MATIFVMKHAISYTMDNGIGNYKSSPTVFQSFIHFGQQTAKIRTEFYHLSFSSGTLKLQDWTMEDWILTDWTLQDWTLTDWTMTDECVGR